MEYSEGSHEGWGHHHHHEWEHGHFLPVLPLIGAFAVLYLIVASGLWLPLLLLGALFFFLRPMVYMHWRRGGWRGHMPGRAPFEGRPPFGRPPMFRHPMDYHRYGGWRDTPHHPDTAPDGQPFDKPKRDGTDSRFV